MGDDLEQQRGLKLTPPREYSEAFIAHLEDMLAEAKKGELLGLLCVRVWKGKEYDWRRLGWIPHGERALGELKMLDYELTRMLYDER